MNFDDRYSPTPTPSPGPSTLFSSLLISPEPPDAVIEKQRLSTSRHSASFLRPFAQYFSPYPMPLPFTHRRLMLPIPNIFYPSSPILTQNFRSNSNFSSLSSFNRQRHFDKRSCRLSLFYLFVLITLIFFTFSKIKSAIKNSSRHIPLPFQDPSTLIFSNHEIVKIWQWEISLGHYPSYRKTPSNLQLNLNPNPSLPKNFNHQNFLSNFSSQSSLHNLNLNSKIISQQQPQSQSPTSTSTSTSTLINDIMPIGPIRNYLDIPSPSVFKSNPSSNFSFPSPYPPRPSPNSIIDLDIIMDYCDFSTNQYVRDCLEILRMGAGLDLEKRVRRGKTSRWNHIYHEKLDHDQNKIPSINSNFDLNPSSDQDNDDQPIKDPSYQPTDILNLLQSQSYPSKLQQIQQQTHNTAHSRRISSIKHPTHPTSDPTCDADYPKIFHIFWAGPFTDKPYLALSSFLFTQNLGLDLPLEKPTPNNQSKRSKFLSTTCRPQLWVWINPGPAAAIPNPNARKEMLDDLKKNPWSAPFLHHRFREVIKFKMWNTTEQLDGVPELKDHWRELPLFNSGGVKYGSAPITPTSHSHHHQSSKTNNSTLKPPVKIGIVVPEEKAKLADKDGDGHGEEPDVIEEELGRFGNHTRGEAAVAEDMSVSPQNPNQEITQTANSSSSTSPPVIATKDSEDELFQRVGSTSSKGYDRLSVVLSDMARFVLCHRFGGIYLDADTILLRDWEELWGWRGQFAYRWSRLEKYNTAVLRLHRHSALGSFLFKTALANGLDFHPMTISRYTKDAHLDGLLLRLPDALFDSAWLNTEYYQRDRPAFPYFKRFEDFFDPPKETDAGPAAIGFDGFFRGAFSYHFHNFWWIPFDPSRNWPDLGPRFESGERSARAKLAASKLNGRKKMNSANGARISHNSRPGDIEIEDDQLSVEDLEKKLLHTIKLDEDDVADDERDLGWATILKRTFEAYLRCERPNMYGEWLDWQD
ncbi:hypothetical protein O181_025273 [Austropuccinia psidii MF-1]|uniref:Glycosyltransferase family 32 protein n=1 Tax=Austropuccinia psidii MF-1 TaxID=1389203 RepID=A0A9Q3GYY7_9BASI|nr:hypothetical protein [Austropuccinia psidii MF-1]